MRTRLLWNDDWEFAREKEKGMWEQIRLPHTWNAVDGQDGGDDYYRGKCWYRKRFENPIADMENKELWLEFRGVAMTAEVFLNGQKLMYHEGGYSTFRVNLTEYLAEDNELMVSADNGANRRVYPQKADFTFYGGIYRDVYLITVPERHFALEKYGESGLRVTPEVKGDSAELRLEISLNKWQEYDSEKEQVQILVKGGNGECYETYLDVVGDSAAGTLMIPKVHLWNGMDDPYLYTVTACLSRGGKAIDEVDTRIGCRTFSVDSEKGFFLNGRSYPLCGVSRHQDRKGVGNALTPAMHREDMELIREMGANTIRLAHYQHDQYFYDLCDEEGVVVWAEIPYITEHMQEGRENTVSQMTELITQNYHHPAIVCWGLSNEITVSGGVDEDLMENHRILNDLCHKMDASRLTTMANVFILDPEEEIIRLPDIRSYNLYYGWYVGEKEENDKWFDAFHGKHPDIAMGLSEYGADALLCYQNRAPAKGDYSEGYQALYHEHMLRMWSERPYIWAMHVWNMFDFAADGRQEAGEPGVNHKGLVSFDRKTRKDAFYIYKAYLSKEPFVHICGRRYADRVEETTEIKVYSNGKKVVLKVDGSVAESKEGDKIFRFRVPIYGEHIIEAVGEHGESDVIHIRKVEKMNPSYVMEKEDIVNWFDREECFERDGYYSIQDTVGEIQALPEGQQIMEELTELTVAAYGEVARNAKMSEEAKQKQAMMPFAEQLKMIGKLVSAEQVSEWNRRLNRIPKK